MGGVRAGRASNSATALQQATAHVAIVEGTICDDRVEAACESWDLDISRCACAPRCPDTSPASCETRIEDLHGYLLCDVVLKLLHLLILWLPN